MQNALFTIHFEAFAQIHFFLFCDPWEVTCLKNEDSKFTNFKQAQNDKLQTVITSSILVNYGAHLSEMLHNDEKY